MTKVCDDITVLDLSQGMAGSLATMMLADAGAEVIKIEPPSGDRFRNQPAWIMWNRGKKSVVLDLKTAEGKEQLFALAGKADVVLTSWSPKAGKRLGIDLGQLREKNPSLVTCAITGWGPLSPYAHLSGYEGIVAAKTGRVHGFDDQITKEGPTFVALNCASFGAATFAIDGILGALHARRTSGLGQGVETSLAQALAAYDWGWYRTQPKLGVPGAAAGPPLSPTPTYFVGVSKDGHWIQMANAMYQFFVTWLDAIGMKDILQEPGYEKLPAGTTEDVEQALRRFLARMQERSRDEWMHTFTKEFDVAAEPFLTTQEGMSHPQVLHKNMVIDVVDPTVGKTRQLAPIAEMSETPMAPQGPAPALGQHTKEVLDSIASRPAPQSPTGKPQPKYPLEGVTVLEFSSWHAGPYGPCILADMGARVIKIEPPDGEPFRALLPLGMRVQQGKESLAVDLKNPEGQKLAHALIKQADIITHNFRPGAPERIGIGYEQVKALNPRAIYHYAASYGSTGPSAMRPAMHPIPGAIAGGALYQAGAGTPPKAGTALSSEEARRIAHALGKANEGNPDVNAALGVATALMLALHARERTGKGQYVETTMLLSSLYANADDAIQYEGKPPRPMPDSRLNGLGATYRFYGAKEGWVFLACPDQGEFEAFSAAVGRPDLARDQRFASGEARSRNDAALVEEIEKLLSTKTAGEWESVLAPAEIACVEVRATGYEDFASNDPAVRESGGWVKVEHAALGEYWRNGPLVTFSTAQTRMGPGTVLGQHTIPILTEMGYSEAQIQEMLTNRAVVAP